MSKIQQAEKLWDTYIEGMEALIVEEAKRVMEIHNKLKSFTDNGGALRFYNKKGVTVPLRDLYNEPTYTAFSTLSELYYKLGGSLGITVSQEER